MMNFLAIKLITCLFFACFHFYVSATYSIIACEKETGVCGAAVATDNFDGGTTADRQIAIIDKQGRSVFHNGEAAAESTWSGYLSMAGVSVQGNGLVGRNVLVSMLQTYQKTQGDLATKLVEALLAGKTQGGQSTGIMSAALLVKTPMGLPFDVDLRVDAHSNPITQLSYLLDLQHARQSIINAQRILHTQPLEAKRLLQIALEKGGSWDRVVKRAIAVAKELNEADLVNKLERKLAQIKRQKVS